MFQKDKQKQKSNNIKKGKEEEEKILVSGNLV